MELAKRTGWKPILLHPQNRYSFTPRTPMNGKDSPFPPSVVSLMWCSRCQQDVPAVPGQRANTLCCVRCQALLSGAAVEASAYSPPEPALPEGIEPLDSLKTQTPLDQLLLPPIPQEDWQLEAELRYVERLAAAWRDTPPLQDSFALASEEQGVSEQRHSHEEPSDDVAPAKPRFAGLAWAALSLGVMSFVCGGVLLGWSAIAGRQDLWSIGLPLALVGQAGLIVGLVLQLETLWQTNRATSQTLHSLDGEIHELRHSTTLLTQSRSNPSQSFYLHLSEGASPHLLLADLKGQLDLLSEQMGKRR